MLLAEQSEKKEWEPAIQQFDLHAKMLADMYDMLQSIRNTLIQVNSKKGKKGPKFKPYARPTTAAQRLSTRVRLQKHNDLAARLLGRSGPT